MPPFGQPIMLRICANPRLKKRRRRCARESSLCRQPGSPAVDDVHVLLGSIGTAVVGAEHHALRARTLDRLAHMRRPEAHWCRRKAFAEISARQLLAADMARSGHALRSRAGPPTIEPPHHRAGGSAHGGHDADLQPRIRGQ